MPRPSGPTHGRACAGSAPASGPRQRRSSPARYPCAGSGRRGCHPRQTTLTATAPGDTMTTDENKAVVRRFIEEIFVEGRAETVDELLADDFVAHTWPSTGDPKADLKRAIERASKAL